MPIGGEGSPSFLSSFTILRVSPVIRPGFRNRENHLFRMNKASLLLVLLGIGIASAAPKPKRAKREAYDLPDGADILVGPVRTSFTCFGDGYYADVENNCQIFHICHSVENSDGNVQQYQWSFLCGNQTLFNQYSLTCASPEEAIPCSEAPTFFYLNDRIRSDDPKTYFLDEEDMQRVEPLLYRNTANAAHSGGPQLQDPGSRVRG